MNIFRTHVGTAALSCPAERSSAVLNEFSGLLGLGVQQIRKLVAEFL